MTQYKFIRVHEEDLDFMMTEIKNRFLRYHPEMEGCPISYAHMFRQLINFAKGEY